MECENTADNDKSRASSAKKSEKQSNPSSPSDIITFNVGGVLYTTTLTTIMSRGDNFLSAMVTNDRMGIMTTTKDENGKLNFFFFFSLLSLCPSL